MKIWPSFKTRESDLGQSLASRSFGMVLRIITGPIAILSDSWQWVLKRKKKLSLSSSCSNEKTKKKRENCQTWDYHVKKEERKNEKIMNNVLLSTRKNVFNQKGGVWLELFPLPKGELPPKIARKLSNRGRGQGGGGKCARIYVLSLFW